MATITSAGSGLWSAGASWVGGVAPADNDAVVIAAGHVIEFDVDTSSAVTWPNGIAGITITGTLKLSRTPGTYYMKMKAATTIGGAGTFDCGASAADIIPFAAKHTITGGAAWYINGAAGMTMTVYAAEPVFKYVKIIGSSIAGQTVFTVDTDVTGDIWANGDAINFDQPFTGASEQRIIAAGGITNSTITVTSGLASSKYANCAICLVTRNVKFIGVGAAGTVCKDFTSGKLSIGGGLFQTANYRAVATCATVDISGGCFANNAHAIIDITTGVTVSGGCFTANGYAFYSDSNLSISGGVFSSPITFQICKNINISGGNFISGSYPINATPGVVISGGTFIDTRIASSCAGLNIFGGTFTRLHTAITDSSVKIRNVIINDSNASPITRSVFEAYNTKLVGIGGEVRNYNLLSRESYSESIDYNQVSGAYKAWTMGGVTSSQAVTVPTGYTTAMQTVLENAAVEGYWQKEYAVGAGASIQFTANLRKAASMTYLPRCIIFNKASADPFAGGAGLHTFTMTDSIDTWEAESWTYTNSTAADVTLVVRFQGMHATATFYSALLAEQINVDLTTALAQIAAVKAKTDNLPADPADESAIEAAITGSIVEGTITYQQALRLMLSVLAGKASGGGTTTVTFRDTGDTKARVTATVDSNGNRSAVVLDGA